MAQTTLFQPPRLLQAVVIKELQWAVLACIQLTICFRLPDQEGCATNFGVSIKLYSLVFHLPDQESCATDLEPQPPRLWQAVAIKGVLRTVLAVDANLEFCIIGLNRLYPFVLSLPDQEGCATDHGPNHLTPTPAAFAGGRDQGVAVGSARVYPVNFIILIFACLIKRVVQWTLNRNPCVFGRPW